MEQVGFVRSVRKNKVEVEVRRISGCGGGCKTCSGCDTPSHIVIIPNTLNAKVGDLVELKGETKNILKYAMIVYMIPFSLLIFGILLGMNFLKNQGINNYEPFSFLIGIIFMAIGYLLVKIIDKKIEKKEDNIIKMTKIL
ncbi:MAG: SoxR reducing system RseC family protein [Tissierellia bacterium]|nr:SoxR reducing system RseC family protein [Tissierellia bacterium]